MDGNGRTGRILNILYLVQQGLLDVPILYLSRFFISKIADAYYQYLREVTENGSWQQWVLYILEAVEETSRDTADKIEAISRPYQQRPLQRRGIKRKPLSARALLICFSSGLTARLVLLRKN